MRVYEKYSMKGCVERLIQFAKCFICLETPLSAVFLIHTRINIALSVIPGHLAWSDFLEYPNCCNLRSPKCQ